MDASESADGTHRPPPDTATADRGDERAVATGGRRPTRAVIGIALAPLRWLRYVLIWPLVTAYEHKASNSLRWRLAESHLLTVFLSLLVIAVIGGAVTVIYSFLQNPVDREPALEAQSISGMIYELELDDIDALSSPDVSTLLRWVVTGGVGPNEFDEDITLVADLGKTFQNIKTITIIGHDQKVIASSEPALVGRDAFAVGPTVPGVALRALGGETDTTDNSSILQRSSNPLVVGAYPVYGPDQDTVIAAVVVDKRERTLPDGGNLVLLAVRYVGQIALTIAILVGIPAIPVATVIGLRRARAIAKPVTNLVVATKALAAGNLDVRAEVAGEDEIADLGRSFNRMADRLQDSIETEAEARERAEKLLAANRELVANVSHELRTPVALVRSHLEALESDPSHFDDYVRITLRETDRLERLVNDLFQLSRLENKIVRLDRAAFEAGAAVREAYESLAEPARRSAGITMMSEIGEGDLRCLGDRARLIQVLQNLIRNAIRFTPEGGIILVGAQLEGDQVAFTVRDTGIGIAPEDLPRVFERFYRSDSSRNRQSGGAGLGLAIAKELIEQMGGTIAVESEVNEGSAFTIRLPRVIEAAAQPPSLIATNGAKKPPANPDAGAGDGDGAAVAVDGRGESKRKAPKPIKSTPRS